MVVRSVSFVASPCLPLLEMPRDYAALIERHRDGIDEVRCLLQRRGKSCLPKLPEGLLPFSILDDRVVVRYLLQFPSAQKAANAMEKAMKWRNDNRDIVKAALDGVPPPMSPEKAAVVAQYFAVGLHPNRRRPHNILLLLRLGLSTVQAVHSKLTHAELRNMFLWSMESQFWWGLTEGATDKMHSGSFMIDLSHFAMRNIDQWFARQLLVFDDVVATGQWLHPLLVGQVVVCNPPFWIRTLWNFCRMFLSKAICDKFVFLPPSPPIDIPTPTTCKSDTTLPSRPTKHSSAHHRQPPVSPSCAPQQHQQQQQDCASGFGSIAVFDPILELVDPEDLPLWLGGNCDCVGGCIKNYGAFQAHPHPFKKDAPHSHNITLDPAQIRARFLSLNAFHALKTADIRSPSSLSSRCCNESSGSEEQSLLTTVPSSPTVLSSPTMPSSPLVPSSPTASDGVDEAAVVARQRRGVWRASNSLADWEMLRQVHEEVFFSV